MGGEVPIRLQSGRTPDEAIANARQARRAAPAPSDPSAQDLAVAAQASQLEQAAAARKSQLAARTYGQAAAKAKGAAGAPEEAQAASGGRTGEEPGQDTEPAQVRSIAA